MTENKQKIQLVPNDQKVQNKVIHPFLALWIKNLCGINKIFSSFFSKLFGNHKKVHKKVLDVFKVLQLEHSE
jgi:hypothetical protein